MLQINRIRENSIELIKLLKIRNFDYSELINKVLELDELRRSSQHSLDKELSELNQMSKKIGEFFKTGNKDGAKELKLKTGKLKDSTKVLKEQLSSSEKELRELLYQIPNVPNPLVKTGSSDKENEILEEFGEIPSLHEGSVPHWDLAKEYQLIDFELGVKITGAGFPVYKGKGAQLQRALINYFLNKAIENGYEEVIPPLLVNEVSGHGTGQLPDKEGQMYYIQEDQLFLIPTAEVPITNIFRDVIVDHDEFPIKCVGYTPCFRREAGSYGKDVRGLNRLHQFDKVEIVQIAHPEKSYKVLDEMVNYVKSLLEDLGLPFRIVRLCGGDLGFTAALTYDFEVYSAAQDKWLEVSSVSNFETYQSNRLKLRYRDNNNKNHLVHTLNGSALALPRIMASILENYQENDGIRIPEVLIPFTGFDKINKLE